MSKLKKSISNLAVWSARTGAALMFCGMTLSPQIAKAQIPNMYDFVATYPNTAGTALDDCVTCHDTAADPSYKTHNKYGLDVLANGSMTNAIAAMKAVENLDSDGDGATNIQEILALTFPGDATSKPAPTPTPVPTPAPTPSADIKINGQDGPLTITTSDSAAVTVSLNANGLSNSADWWAVLNDANGNWHYYDLASQSYLSGLTGTYQGALFDLGSFPLATFTNLPKGANTFYFGVDLTPDGQVTQVAGQLFYDTVVVTVQ